MKNKESELQLKKARLKHAIGIIRELLQDIDEYSLVQSEEEAENYQQ